MVIVKTSKKYILIGLGAAVGAVLRYVCEQTIEVFTTSDIAVLFVNITGCFVISMATGLYMRKRISETTKVLVVTGFCGGLTTFSSFVSGMELLINSQHYISAMSYILLNMILSLIAVSVGMNLGLRQNNQPKQ